MNVKFPHITVKLVGNDGNAFGILHNVKTAMKKGGCSKADIDAYFEEATTGDYDHLLQVTMATVEVE